MTQLAKLLLLRIPSCSSPAATALAARTYSSVGNYQDLLTTRLLKLGPHQYLHASRLPCQLNSKLQDLMQHVYHTPAWKLHLGTIFGFSVAGGFVSSLPEFALAERNQQEKVWDPSIRSGKWDEGQSRFLAWARRLWIPMLLVITVVMGWNYPVSLAVNIAFLLFSTKPTPSSIYLWVEQWRQQSLHESPGFDWLKLGPALRVEVRDYKLLCLAQITSINQKMTMIGILGEWWILYSSSYRFNFGPLFVSSPFVRDTW